MPSILCLEASRNPALPKTSDDHRDTTGHGGALRMSPLPSSRRTISTDTTKS